ncbi:MAG: DUF1579 domain-containing protein [Phycisphaerae bacterium]
MNRNRWIACGVVFAAGVVASFAIADPPKAGQPAAGDKPPEMKLPPGWTEADMKACMMAGTPGKMHEHLTRQAGVWQGKNTMWMAPGAEATHSESTTKITPMMDGRFIQVEVSGDMPGMGPFMGHGIYGYDNVTQKFIGTWIDNCGTGMMTGTGELSADGKTLTWTYTYNCPIAKKAVTMREIDKETGASTKTMEMYGTDPKTGKEYKMMSIDYVRKS